VVTTGNWFYQANDSGIYGSYTQTEEKGLRHLARAVILHSMNYIRPVTATTQSLSSSWIILASSIDTA